MFVRFVHREVVSGGRLSTCRSAVCNFRFFARALNRVGQVASSFGLEGPRLKPDRLMAAARGRTGLDDFGADDGWRQGLDELLAAFREAGLSTLGRVAVYHEILRNLVTRLRLVQNWKQYPKILAEEVAPLLVIVALPRTGTTLLHNLLAQDPRARVPRMWELLFPSPPPVPNPPANDARLVEAAKIVANRDRLVPELVKMHPLKATGADECWYILTNTFVCAAFDAHAPVPSYSAWFLRQDQAHVYSWHRKVLQQLQWRHRGDYWILKSPLHLFGIDALLREYPNARIVQTHRNPEQTVASCCSLYESARRIYREVTDPRSLGAAWLEFWEQGLKRTVQAKAQLPPHRIYDIDYEQLISEPIEVVRHMYDHFGLNVAFSMVDGMRAWLIANPQHKHGIHAYHLERYGLDGQELTDRFSRYGGIRSRAGP